jgi:hypothetical protein
MPSTPDKPIVHSKPIAHSMPIAHSKPNAHSMANAHSKRRPERATSDDECSGVAKLRRTNQAMFRTGMSMAKRVAKRPADAADEGSGWRCEGEGEANGWAKNKRRALV